MRFNLVPIVKGHWKSLANVNKLGEHVGADIVTRSILGVLSVGAATWVYLADVAFAAPAALLSGFALLSGVLLSVFAQLASMRTRLTDSNDSSNRTRVLKDSLDESVAHVLIAALLGLLASVTIVVSMAMYEPPIPEAPAGVAVAPAPSSGPEIMGWPAVVVAAIATYEVLLLIMVIGRLYSAYTRVNDVSPRLDGHKSNH